MKNLIQKQPKFNKPLKEAQIDTNIDVEVEAEKKKTRKRQTKLKEANLHGV